MKLWTQQKTTYSVRQRFQTMPQSFRHSFLLSLLILLLCSGIGYLFFYLGFAESNTITVYIIGTLIIAAFTDKMIYWIIPPVAAVLLFNCLYSEPRFTLLYYDPRNTVTLVLLLPATIMVGYMFRMFRRWLAERSTLTLQAESERLRANLLRSIGHDLRTPLTGISGDAQLLLSKGEQMEPVERLRMYEHILDNSDWLIAMVENILYVTRLDDGKIEIVKYPELLSDLIEESLQHINKKSTQHNIKLKIDNDLIFVNVDAHMIIQVLINIINNAIRHTPKGSTIIISLRENGEDAEVEIADDGPGVNIDTDRMFDMFYSSGSTPTGERPGIGLGLSLAKTIIEAHGGQIYYRANQPHGAIFGFTLKRERMGELQ